MPTPKSNVAFTVFGLDIMWYGLLIASGMMIALLISYKRAPKHGLDPEKIYDVGLYCLPTAVIGARFWYVLFHWDYYAWDFMKIINIRQGGLAIHGGLLFGIGKLFIESIQT